MIGSRKLDIVRDIAERKGIKGLIENSDRPGKRFVIYVPLKNGKTHMIHFGSWPYKLNGAYIDHHDDDIRKNWRARHSKIRKDYDFAYKDPSSPEYYSWNLLW
jgi:hypothetical protein